MKIEELGLSARAYHVLQNAKIETVEQLREIQSNPFVKIGSIGSSVFNEIQEKLAAHTLTNADRIRAMTDEQLATFLDCFSGCAVCREAEQLDDNPFLKDEKCDEDCEAHILEWLKQPAKEETK